MTVSIRRESERKPIAIRKEIHNPDFQPFSTVPADELTVGERMIHLHDETAMTLYQRCGPMKK